MAFTFLSKEWFDELERVRAEMGEVEVPAAMQDVVINLIVTSAPDGDVEACLDKGAFAPGSVPDAPTTITVPYDTAKKMFVEGDQMAAMQAFMGGQVKITGDQTKIMALQQAGMSNPAQEELQEKMRAFTAS